jgi:hypothetical protein
LPSGLDSYPQATVKGSVIRAMFPDTERSRFPPRGLIPAPAEEHIHLPPAVTDWIPETHQSALIGAVFDTRFRGAGGLPAFDAWAIERNRALLRGPLYRIMFLVLSPERILSGAQERWGAFHRGSQISVVTREPRSTVARLAHASNLFSEHAIRWFACSFQVAVEAGGAKNARVEAEVESATSTRFHAAWE